MIGRRQAFPGSVVTRDSWPRAASIAGFGERALRRRAGLSPDTATLGDRNAHGLLSQIPRIHLVLRLAYRLEQAFLPEGIAKRGRLRVANVAGTLGDVTTWAVLRRTRGSGIAWRLPADLAELAFWESRTPDGSINATALALPLALESTARWRFPGFGVAFADMVAMGFGRRIGGRRARPAGLAFLGAVSVGGLGWARIRDRRLAQERRAHAAHLEARQLGAYLAGQNSVAMGADTVVDALEAIAPILGPAPRGSALHRLLDSWKASLAEQTARRSVYLGVALMGWQRRHNLHPDLSSYVELSLAPGDGTRLLTADQAIVLETKLDGLSLRGRVSARVESSARAADELPGRPLRLQVGSHTVTIPRDTTARVTEYDPAPAILLAGAGLALAPGQRMAEDVPLPWLLPCGGAFGLAAWWARNELETRGPEATWDVLRAAHALSAGTSIVATAMQRRPFGTTGQQNTPFVTPMLPSIYLLAIHWRRLSAVQRGLATAALGTLTGGCIAMLPRPLHWTELAVDVWWLLSNWVGASGLDAALRAEAAQFGAELRADDERVVEEAFQQGRDFVLDLVNEALCDAKDRFGGRKAALALQVQEHVRGRLDDIDDRIAALRAG